MEILSKQHDVEIVRYEHQFQYKTDPDYSEPAVGRCLCGAKVYTDENFIGLTECKCGRWYYMDGTELEPSE